MVGAPELTLVVPVHDAELYLPDTLASIDRNAEADLQLVLIDDGSRDRSPELLDEFAATRGWVEVIRHDAPRGPAAARNAGLGRAVAPFVSFLDADDWLAPGYLADLVRVVTTSRCDFVRVDHVQVRGRDRVLHLAPEGRRDVVLDPRSGILPASRRTMVDYPFPPMGVYRRSLGDLLTFDESLHTAEDRLWTWRLHVRSTSYAVSSLAGMFYRRLVSSSLTQVGDARQLHFVDAFAKILDEVAGRHAYEVKALRQFFAILLNQLKSAPERLSVELRAELDRRARSLIRGVDPVLIDDAMPTDGRARALQEFLPEPAASLTGAVR